MSKKYQLDTNLLYHLSGVFIASTGKSISEIEFNLHRKVFYVSEWSIIEILLTDKPFDIKEKIIHYLVDKKIPIIPIISEYTELPRIFSNIYSSNNYSKIIIPNNEFQAYKLDGDITNSFVCDSTYINEIRNIKIDCESRCFEAFIILFLTFICSYLQSRLDSKSKKYRNVSKEKKTLFYYVSSKKIEEIMFEETIDLKKLLQEFYAKSIDKESLNKSLTIHVYQAIIKYITVFNNIMSGESFKKYRKSIKYLSSNNTDFDYSKLQSVDKTIDISAFIKKLSHNQFDFPALSTIFPNFKYIDIKQSTVHYFLDQHKGIMKYNCEFIEYFFSHPHIIDKNDILDSLLLTNYDDVIVLTFDKLFSNIMSKFNLKHYKAIKDMVLL